MGKSVSVNPPKTPCTEETRGMAKATIPNICKMPGPPAPFVPAPLPNIGKSNLSPKGYSTTVKIEGFAVAIRGATFESMGDVASKGTGGGLISANTHGPTKFITPGSMNVQIEGKAVHQLAEPMLNNCGPSGSPPNTGATMQGFDTWDLDGGSNPLKVECENAPKRKGSPKLSKCEKEEICAKCAEINEQAKTPGSLDRPAPAVQVANRATGNALISKMNAEARAGNPPNIGFTPVSPDCYEELKTKAKANNYSGFSPDHMHEIQLGGHPTDVKNLRWMSSKSNEWIGRTLKEYNKPPAKHTGVKPDCCDNFK